jgi:D-threo-aldose 1-dehydrogenase
MDPLERRPLGRSAVEVTRFGFGGAPMGERFVPVDNETADAVLQQACAEGINYFDTAPQYGQGKSEARIGRTLQTRPRDSVVISTKVGHLLERPRDPAAFAARLKGNGHHFQLRSDYSHDAVMRSYEDSLQRLGLSRVDVLVIHDIDLSHHGDRETLDRHFRELTAGGGWRALESLKAAGEIKAIGCGVNSLGAIPEVLDRGEVDFFLLAMPYTLADQSALDEDLPRCAERGVGIVIGAVFASGILATGPTPASRYAYEPAPEEMKAKVGRIEAVCRRHGVPMPAAALQFPLAHPLVAAVIPGAHTVGVLQQNLGHFRQPIPTALWAELKAEGLLRADAPTPG